MQLRHARTKSGHPHTDADRDLYAHTQSRTNLHFDADSNAHTHLYPNTDAYLHTNVHTDSHLYAQPDAHTASAGDHRHVVL
jgi:hypothetical protein